MKSVVLPVLQALVTVALLAWIFSDPTLRTEGASLWRQASWGWALMGLLAGGINELASIARWSCCLRMAGLTVGFRRAAELHFTGLFATFFLPGSAGGDAFKISSLALQFPERRMGGALAVIMDRLSGLAAIMTAALVAVALRRDWLASTPQTAGVVRGVMIFFAVAVGGIFFWYLGGHPFFRNRHPRWMPFRERFLELAGVFGLFFSGGRRAVASVGLSFVTLAAYFSIFYCAARSLSVAVSLPDMATIMPLIDVVTLLPVTLNGIGLREKAFETLLGALCGVPASGAVLVSLGGFGLYAVWSLLGAPLFLVARGVGRLGKSGAGARTEAVHE